jgi:phosphoribosylanthranilate isomerase
LHGDEARAELVCRGVSVWKAVRVTAGFHLAAYAGLPVEALLLDGPAGELYGGAGKTFDWRVARESGRKIVLAGGLDASNVAAAVELAQPWGVDACSRIESAPGRKDHRKMSEFLERAMAAAHV